MQQGSQGKGRDAGIIAQRKRERHDIVQPVQAQVFGQPREVGRFGFKGDRARAWCPGRDQRRDPDIRADVK